MDAKRRKNEYKLDEIKDASATVWIGWRANGTGFCLRFLQRTFAHQKDTIVSISTVHSNLCISRMQFDLFLSFIKKRTNPIPKKIRMQDRLQVNKNCGTYAMP